MPIYEFYCPDCHRIFNFFSRRINVTKRPSCPRCGRPEIQKQMSIFSISKNQPDNQMDDPLSQLNLDEQKMEQALLDIAAEANSIDENNPKQAAKLMRKLISNMGIEVGGSIEEAIRRMEKGEDIEKIEEDMADSFSDDELLSNIVSKKGIKALRKRYLPPEIDDTLYEL